MATSSRPRAQLRPVDRKPIYEQVSDRLREFIDVNQLQPGDRLMAERELAQQLGWTLIDTRGDHRTAPKVWWTCATARESICSVDLRI